MLWRWFLQYILARCCFGGAVCGMWWWKAIQFQVIAQLDNFDCFLVYQKEKGREERGGGREDGRLGDQYFPPVIFILWLYDDEGIYPYVPLKRCHGCLCFPSVYSLSVSVLSLGNHLSSSFHLAASAYFAFSKNNKSAVAVGLIVFEPQRQDKPEVSTW